MIRKLKSLLGEHRNILANFSYLSILQIVNMALPLVSYPYILKTIGKENYGLIIYSQAVINYLAILVNFGFNATATKDVSIYRNNSTRLNSIVSVVFQIKGLLFLISCVFLFLYLVATKNSSDGVTLYILTMWMCVYEFLFPVWFFQGIQKMKFITIITVINKGLFTALIFLFIRNPSDFIFYPILNFIGISISVVYSFRVLHLEKIKFSVQKWRFVLLYLRKSYVMAIAYASNTFKGNFNIILIGNLISLPAAAYFDLALKIVNIGTGFLDLISQAIFPKLSKQWDKKFFLNVLKISIIVAIAMTFFTQLLSGIIINIFGGGAMTQSILLLKILAVNFPIYIAGALLGRNCLLVFGLDRYVLISMVLSSIVYLFCILADKIIFNETSLVSLAAVYLISFLFELFYRYYITRRHNII